RPAIICAAQSGGRGIRRGGCIRRRPHLAEAAQAAQRGGGRIWRSSAGRAKRRRPHPAGRPQSTAGETAPRFHRPAIICAAQSGGRGIRRGGCIRRRPHPAGRPRFARLACGLSYMF
ncbi:MAG: hypothetical protein LBG79_00905, partial [Spirochaetaceae bacterium]|nr:hypothetical protein [Spirochaetaceae bacterium]